MGSSEKFCLRWNDFESNISVAFREIREEKDLLDCTLSCGSRQIQAHKLILSACSPFFRSILKQNPHQHPLLYLKGVGFSELQSVLNFMYHGEVNIAQDELNSFLSVAEELQVKGLTQNNAPANSKPENQKSSQLESIPTPKRARPRPLPASPHPSQPVYHQSQPDEVHDVTPLPVVKIEPQPAPYTSTPAAVTPVGYGEEQSISDNMGTEVVSMQETYEEAGYDDYGGYEGQGYEGGDTEEYSGQGYGSNTSTGQTGFGNHILKTGSGFTCAECGKEFNDQSNCRRHVKISHNHFAGELSCEYCQKTYKNNYSLKDHLRKTHGVYNILVQ